jgi:hypothetical protein
MYSKLHAIIPLLGGTSMKVNFQMLHFLPNVGIPKSQIGQNV